LSEIYKPINNIIFKDKTFEADKVFILVQNKTWNWILRGMPKLNSRFVFLLVL